jgi:integrase
MSSNFGNSNSCSVSSRSRERTLALLDAGTGLRVSELLALRWRDVDFENLELNVTHSIWHQIVGGCKTEASAKLVPLDSYMADDLQRWRRQSACPMEDDYIFASETMKGKQPYWPDNLMKRHILPVARANGSRRKVKLGSRTSWHPKIQRTLYVKPTLKNALPIDSQ